MVHISSNSNNTIYARKTWRWPKWLVRIIKAMILGVVIIGLLGVAFIKFDTPAAAEFTDHYLRPLFGAERIIALEKIFFNSSDSLAQQTYRFKKPESPIIDREPRQIVTNTPGKHLDLTPITTNYFQALPNEGTWLDKPLSIFPNQSVMAYTFMRPDAQRSYAFVTLVQIDTKVIGINAVAGTSEPGGRVGKPGPGRIPKEAVQSNNLVAAFDGGFQYRDGAYGMIVAGKTYLPLKTDTGTFVAYKDGSLKIVNYDGQDLGKDVTFIRQNCPILLQSGTVTPLDPKIKALWGRTLTSDIYTWRSGIGLTATGNLMYAVGNNLTPITLAYALKAAGVVDAIQLDINPYWVRFNIFNSTGNGKYTTTTLTQGLQDGSKQYLNGYQKDFFYLYKK